MASITIYQKPTCTTCRRVYTILKEAGIDFEAVNYHTDPLSKNELKSLLKKMRMPAADLLRKKESVYKKLGLAGKKLSEEKLIDLMVRYPDLIQRPIVEKGDRALLARPAETISRIL